jgi:hypothetical protein
MKLLQKFALVLIAATLAACGGGGGGASSAAPVTPVTPPAPPLAPLKYPIPAGLWAAPAGSAPSSGNYVYLQSDNGDYIGGGRTYSYTNAQALINVTADGVGVGITVHGDQNWYGSLTLPAAAGNLQAGYFDKLTRVLLPDSAGGRMDWSGEGRGCNTLTGWAVIDSVTLENNVPIAIDLRFEQHCEGGLAALHGQIHWTKADASLQPNAEPKPIPATLWQPDSSVVPASGNYLYLESMPGDYIGGGRRYLYTGANAMLAVSGAGVHASVNLTGDQSWTGEFQGLGALAELKQGYYDGLQRYPFNNPVLGGLSWYGDGRGCNQLSGWFAVDHVSYSNGSLSALDLRFEQYCDGNPAPLRGKLHWTADDTSAVPGPVLPLPAGLWKPDASQLPLAGNYVYLVSDPGDYIGAGVTSLLTPPASPMTVQTNLTAALRIDVGGWSGNFVGMNTLSQLKPGYYGGLQRYPFQNPIKGGMDWSGNGRGCNTLSGWFVVDQVSYSLGVMTSIDLRFEQHCEGGTAALHGAVHWAQ